jgi:two-component system chemotaxis response regulator CheY
MERMFQMSKILLVDDASFMRMMIKDALMKNGYSDLYEASDGVEAVSKYSEIKPVLVIMDITMVGLDALKAIKKIDPNANVVMCSAMGQEAMVIDAIKSGARDFIVKPFKPERILKTVSSVLG